MNKYAMRRFLLHSSPFRVGPKVVQEKLLRAKGMIAKGLTVREAATRLKVGKTALYEALRE